MTASQVNSDYYMFTDSVTKELHYKAKRAAATSCTVLITGESGTGKSKIAKFIHDNGLRRERPFVTVNCSAIPSNLLESELFGYLPGAFTGANKTGKKGLVESADGGTLFLDEIGDVPLELQGKFLELLQNHTFIPVGGLKKCDVDVQIIAATNVDLKTRISEKSFREDLYYRLHVVECIMPPLRERRQDLKALIDFFIERFSIKYGLMKHISDEAVHLLLDYDWPGNIRELENVIERVVILSREECITISDFPLHMSEPTIATLDFEETGFPKLDEYLEKQEKQLILKAFNRLGSSYKVADTLGISQSRATRLYKKYKEKP
ncbi:MULTISPECIES: sigma-54-dependent Fis family transcriptional regulator [unclassified Fusibacter]|uniref:sigma-54 interaction domain-containing protein n=1 Tax=unclassified Fusibacter TaxID=2624464 RepID=UPI0013E91484|nr:MULTISPECIES: sigma 54-interacting transcriptional regulator [unclassified Fusibacter]MCK8060103.1 sigma 54-interacting transcriptional regulator [Fusibacter sp. A2]NPE22245.1 sigma 54-interacting transcriptional regulator [Fusibacter sp. A1]